MDNNQETPNHLEGLGDGLSAEVLKKLNEVLELLHQQDHSKQGSTVINIYADGSQHVENGVGNVEAGGIYNNFGGATIHHLVINGNMTKSGPEYYGESQEKTVKKDVTNEKLARAIENCQQFFWGNSSYAVLFCILRDDYNMIPNKNAFETKIEQLDYQKKRSHFCKAGTIANAFSDNAIFNLPVNKWEEQNAPNRIIMLRDKLREELEL